MNVNSMKKNIFKKISYSLVLGFFVAFLLVSPISFSFSEGLHNNVTEAAGGIYGSPDAIEAVKKVDADKQNTQPGNPLEKVGQWLGNMILSVAGLVTWLGAQLLNGAIQFTIVEMGKNLTGGGIGQQINALWGVIRDVCNLVFIFGFVYIGIMTILSPGKTDTKRFLAQLIISALLINFSLFFVKIIVDVTNVLALEVHGLMGNGDVTSAIMQEMGLSTFYTTKSPDQLAATAQGGSISFYIGAFFFLVIAGIVFAVGAVMLVVRFIAIILLMIFSPFMIAGFVFPATSKQARELWDRLIGYSLYPAIFLFLVYISIKMLGTSSLDAGTGLGDVLQNGNTLVDGNVSAIIKFVIAIGFLIAAMQVAQRFSSYMGSRATGIEKWARNGLSSTLSKAGGTMTAGLAGAGLRATAGRAGAALADSKTLKDYAGRGGLGGKSILQLSNAAAGANFDARHIGGVGKKLGIGEGSKASYNARVEEHQKRADAYSKMLGQVDDDDIRVRAQQEKVGQIEKEIRELKEEKDATNDVVVKKAKAEEIAAKERELQEQKNKVEQEKNRRIIGSSFVPEKAQQEIDEIKKLISENIIDPTTKKVIGSKGFKAEMRSAAKKYANALNEVERSAAEDAYKKAQDGLEKAEKDIAEIRKKAGIKGYADIVEGSNYFEAKVNLRNRGISKTVGEALRKQHSKKIKEEKEAKK